MDIIVKSPEDVYKERLANDVMDYTPKQYVNSLYAHIKEVFRTNADHKESSGVNDLLSTCLQLYNGEYSDEEQERIKSRGEPSIWMNLTSTKVNAAVAQIKGGLLSETDFPADIKPTPVMGLPEEFSEAISAKLSDEFNNYEGEPEAMIKASQERKRDLYDAIEDELRKEAEFAFKIYERKIKDSMIEGDWRAAFSQVIDDIGIFPTAILKGPVVTVEPRLTYEGGKPIVTQKKVKKNIRVSPFDVFPAPESDSAQTGDFIEVMKLTRKDVAALRHNDSYDQEAIDRILMDDKGKSEREHIAAGVEEQRATSELKESAQAASDNLFPAMHFFGTVPVKILREWRLTKGIEGLDENDEVSIEAITVDTEVIKCRVNEDPLGRRPYFTASFQPRPGSFWGNCIPLKMEGVQKVCNATVRSLVLNMSYSSGPVAELNIDRLADNTEVPSLMPRDIIQVTNDPSGRAGRAVNFFNIPSNSAELLAIYDKFEQKADDITMIPRYSYGGTGAGNIDTASGMSMMLSQMTKGIESVVNNIDEGILIPRIKYEFYYLMLGGEDIGFTGDIEVIATGSKAIKMKAAQQMRRNEFLNILSNPTYAKIVGPEAIAKVLSEVMGDLFEGERFVPNRQEIKLQQQREAEAASQQQSEGAMITQMQVEAQREATQANAQMKDKELAAKREKDAADVQIKVEKLRQDANAIQAKTNATLQKTQMETKAKTDSDNKQIALSLKTGDRMN